MKDNVHPYKKVGKVKQNIKRLKFAVLIKNIHLQIHSNCLDNSRYNFSFQHSDTGTSDTWRFQIVLFVCFVMLLERRDTFLLHFGLGLILTHILVWLF